MSRIGQLWESSAEGAFLVVFAEQLRNGMRVLTLVSIDDCKVGYLPEYVLEINERHEDSVWNRLI